MTRRAVLRPNFATRLLPIVPLGFGMLCATECLGQSQPEDTTLKLPVFEVASIKPNKSGTPMVMFRFTPDGVMVTNSPLKLIIQQSYGVEENQIVSAPGWVNSDRFDVEAKVDGADAPKLHDLKPRQRMEMLQPLLADRFQLKVHRETRELPVYELVIAKNGPKLHEAKPGDTYPNGIKGPDGKGGGPGLIWFEAGQLTCQAATISTLTSLLAQRLGHNVLDKTGLTGKYDIVMPWPEEQRPAPMFNGAEAGQQENPPESSGASIFTILQEQLGLKLESHKAPVEVLVIDHVEPPSAN